MTSAWAPSSDQNFLPFVYPYYPQLLLLLKLCLKTRAEISTTSASLPPRAQKLWSQSSITTPKSRSRNSNHPTSRKRTFIIRSKNGQRRKIPSTMGLSPPILSTTILTRLIALSWIYSRGTRWSRRSCTRWRRSPRSRSRSSVPSSPRRRSWRSMWSKVTWSAAMRCGTYCLKQVAGEAKEIDFEEGRDDGERPGQMHIQPIV